MPEAEGARDTLETLQEIANLELEYVTNTEFSARAEVIYKISDVGTPAAIPPWAGFSPWRVIQN